MKRFFIFSVIVSFFIVIPEMSGKDYFTSSRILRQEDGLSSNIITSLTKDTLGTIWAGTTKGLDRIFENKVIRYDFIPEFNNNEIRFVTTDNTGQVWVGVFGGLFRYDYARDTFIRTDVRGEELHPIASTLADDGIIFYTEEGFVKWKYSDRSMKITRMDKEFDFRYSCFTMADSTTVIAARNADGIYRIDLKRGRDEKICRLDSTTDINDIRIDSLGRIWIAVYNEGVKCLSPDGLSAIGFFPQDGKLLDGHIAIKLYEYKGTMFVMTDGGGIRTVGINDFTVSDLDTLYGINLPQETCYAAMMLVSNDELWMGTNHHGIIRLRKSMIQYMNASDFGFDNRFGPNGSIVSCLTEGHDGKIWIGTDGAGISIYDPGSGTCLPLNCLHGTHITSIASAGSHRMLIAVYSKGLYLYDTESRTASHLDMKDSKANAVIQSMDIVVKLKTLPDGNILIAARDIYSFNPNTGDIGRYGLSGMSNFRIAYAGRDSILVYNLFEIYRIDRHTGKVEQLLYTSEGNINQVKKAGKDIMVIKAYSLARLGKNGTEDIPFLYNGHIHSMETGPDGALWLATDTKIIRLAAKNTGRYRILSDKLMSDEFMPDATFLSSSGDIFFGGYSGLYAIKTEKADRHQENFRISPVSVSVDGVRTNCNVLPDNTWTITAPHGYSSLELDICTVGGDILKDNRFRYTIGNGKRQIVLYSDSHLTLPSLPSGTHNVDIAYIDNTDNWTSHSDIISIHIPPPDIFWIILTILLVLPPTAGGVFFILHRSRLKKDKEQEEEAAASQESDDSDRMFMKKIDAFIDANISNDQLNAQTIIDYMCMGRTSFYKKIKKLTGSGIVEYIVAKRMSEAAEMLKNSNKSISEIAFSVGYNDNLYFSKVFKQHFGQAPSNYRKAHR